MIKLPPALQRFQTPFVLLLLMTIANQIGFSAWTTILNNFAEHEAGFNGADIGLLQSIREIPGFLAFTAIFVLLLLREQVFALLALVLLAIGVMATGMFPTLGGLLITTFIMSTGFHYFETMNQSLQLQWLPRATAPRQIGQILAAGSVGQLIVFGLIILFWQVFGWSYALMLGLFGGATLVLVALMTVGFPQFREDVPQIKKIVLRKRYWLYYALVFLGGARRQIFVVFAAWMMVEKFGYTVENISYLFIINVVFNMYVAPRVGAMIIRYGERAALSFEYLGLVIIFTSYAFVTDPNVAAALYVIDNAFFALAIAQKTYLQKIADPQDMAPTSSVAFTINHIIAVVMPASFGLIWLFDPAFVFLTGAALSLCSLVLAQLVPRDPDAGNEVRLPWRPAPAPAQ
ncbi:MAG TPA: MFS transporter [Devosiaceae bacterium]